MYEHPDIDIAPRAAKAASGEPVLTLEEHQALLAATARERNCAWLRRYHRSTAIAVTVALIIGSIVTAAVIALLKEVFSHA